MVNCSSFLSEHYFLMMSLNKQINKKTLSFNLHVNILFSIFAFGAVSTLYEDHFEHSPTFFNGYWFVLDFYFFLESIFVSLRLFLKFKRFH